ncbi:hypothetical protein AcW1_007097 [Taiwanofungus camphoratus]|nr:hypothetical protein AcV5_005401 [Antrodia cinnamomea]KAI0925233.1 hypothetical protein AcW2_005908 [Antrodia cinnamomea]KAI0929569.1 hypothetical protein AcV7_005062 [Antrodia cinnamomea]KAI0955543.1 hypothetical protein AcW1_007097 [Antrodia cinnamomea]
MSQLSRQSGFFRDLFSLPQPVTNTSHGCNTESSSNGDDYHSTIEGCPVIQLHDAAEDLINLLRGIYDGPIFGNNDREDFRVVSGILRLSTKYLVDSLRAKALAHLCTAWPSTLRGWDAREDLARAYEMERTAHRGYRFPSPIAIISLAREIHAPELLPSAFYDLSRYHYTQIYEPSEDEPLRSMLEPHSLSSSDMVKLALGKETSQNIVTSLIQGMASGSHRENASSSQSRMVSRHRQKSSGQICVSAAACRKDFSELVELASQHYLIDRERGCSDPLYVAEELGQLKSAEFSECKACSNSLETWAARERERMWRLIPSWFRLETWDSMRHYTA